jgi:DNA/RNA non-specific endonuclease
VKFSGPALDELNMRLGGKYNEILNLFDQLTPQGGHTLSFESGKLKLIDEAGTVWIDDITNTQIVAKGGTDPWNKFLNIDPPLMKSFEYVVDNNFKYQTDINGRVSKITVENLQTNQTRQRSSYQQQKAKDIKDGKPTDGVNDDGGHMVASQFWGPSEQINYFPQNAAQNRSGGDWYKMEQELKQLRLVNPMATIKVEIVPEFTGMSKRPDRFAIRVCFGT